jgi:hypothetical protein
VAPDSLAHTLWRDGWHKDGAKAAKRRWSGFISSYFWACCLMSVGLESQPVLCPNIRFKTLPKPTGRSIGARPVDRSDRSGSVLLPCKLTPNPISLIVNPCCNRIVGSHRRHSPEAGSRQCDFSLQQLLVQRPSGRSLRVRSSSPQFQWWRFSRVRPLTIQRTWCAHVRF